MSKILDTIVKSDPLNYGVFYFIVINTVCQDFCDFAYCTALCC
nr:MAG TPA: hypothetical protein [Caudoviricetes sp.]